MKTSPSRYTAWRISLAASTAIASTIGYIEPTDGVGQQVIQHGPLSSRTHWLRAGEFSTDWKITDSFDNQFHGLISNFQIYDGAISKEEIEKLVKP
jgi:hypothetical protein